MNQDVPGLMVECEGRVLMKLRAGTAPFQARYRDRQVAGSEE